MGQNIAKNMWQFLIWAVLTKKNIENARVILLFCHTSENTLYSLMMNIAVIGNQQATMTNGSKNLWEFFISAVLTKSYWKCESKTFVAAGVKILQKTATSSIQP